MDGEDKLQKIINLLTEINEKLDRVKISPSKKITASEFKQEVVEQILPKKLTQAEKKANEKKAREEWGVIFQAQHTIKNSLKLKRIPSDWQVKAYLASGDISIFDKNKRAT